MKYLRAIAGILLLVVLDQYTKYMVISHLNMYEYHPLAGDVFGFFYLENAGMAWGTFQGKQILFLIFTVLVLVGAVFVYIRLLQDSFFRPLNVCIIFLVSGAIGNMIDRMFHGEFLHGAVVDFLYIKAIDFPVFNVADIFVTGSIACIIILTFTKYKNTDFELILSCKYANDETNQESNDGTSKRSNLSESITVSKSEDSKDTTASVKQNDEAFEKMDARGSSVHKLNEMFSKEEEDDE